MIWVTGQTEKSTLVWITRWDLRRHRERFANHQLHTTEAN